MIAYLTLLKDNSQDFPYVSSFLKAFNKGKKNQLMNGVEKSTVILLGNSSSF